MKGNEGYQFRPITRDDIVTLHGWRNLPHVAQWWDPPHPSYQTCVTEYTTYMRPNYNVEAFIIVRKGKDIGYIQKWSAHAFPDYNPYVEIDPDEVGIDIFIGKPTMLHKGHGTAAARQFIRDHVFAEPSVPACIIDPLPESTAAIRSYEKVGFQHVRTFKHDGKGVYFMRLPRGDFAAS